jgi:hypothetical protein
MQSGTNLLTSLGDLLHPNKRLQQQVLENISTWHHTPVYNILHGWLLTPWSRVLQKLTSSQLVKKFPAFYGTQRFITAFTSARHLSLYLARSIQSMPPFPIPEDLSYYYPPLGLGLQSGLFPSGFPIKILYAPLPSPPHTCYMPCLSHSSQFDHPNNIWWAVQIIKLLIM